MSEEKSGPVETGLIRPAATSVAIASIPLVQIRNQNANTYIE